MTDTRVAIVGGGVMGVSLLYHLVKAGWSDVMLIEKNELTHGSTWHAAGLCTHFAHNPTIQELRATSVRLYRDILLSETGQTCGFHASGAMRVTRNPDRMAEFAHVAGLSEFTGYPLEVLTPERIAELYPLAKLDGLLGGIFEPDDGHVDPTLATNAMAQVATENGATILRRSPVLDIRFEHQRWQLTTADHQISAEHIVNAAGTWGWEVGKMMGLNIPSVPVLHQYLVTDSIPEITQRVENGLPELPIIRDPEESWYLRQERDGFILGPYERDAKVWSVDGVPDDFGADLFPADLDRVQTIIEQALDRVPALANGGVSSVINGPITFTPDANPLIGPAHSLYNGWLLTGSSMGVMEGGGAGWFLAHWITKGYPPMDALAVDSRRFGSWADRSYRVDKAIECFGLQFGVHYPFEERPAARDKRLSPLHHLMLERGAVMGVAHGHERPNWFRTPEDPEPSLSFYRPDWFQAVAREVRETTNNVALSDMSVLSKFEVSGPDTRRFVDSLGANYAPATGRIGLTHALTAAGGVSSEFTVAMISESLGYLTSAAAAEEIDLDLLRQHSLNYNVNVVNRTDELAVIAVMGPNTPALLNELMHQDSKGIGQNRIGNNPMTDLPWLSVCDLHIGDVEVRAMRLSYIGECGWELHVSRANAVALFEMLETVGKTHKPELFGAYAANSMRLEKGYRAWGADLTTERSPLEAGLNAFVKREKKHYRGYQAMLDRELDTESKPWRMVLLEVEAEEEIQGQKTIDPFYTHTVFKSQTPVGIITSASFGHRCQKMLALAYLRDAEATSPLQVSILGKSRQASIIENIPFDPENLRLKI